MYVYFLFDVSDEKYFILASIPASWYLISSFILLVLSQYMANRWRQINITKVQVIIESK